MATKAGKPELKVSNYTSGVVDVLLCPKGDGRRYHDADCIYQECDNCDMEKQFRQHYGPLVSNGTKKKRGDKNGSGSNPRLTWKRWETSNDELKKKVLVMKNGYIKDLLDEAVEDIMKPTNRSTFVKHHFQSEWQQRQFLTIQQNLAKNHVIMVLDFGKNRPIRHIENVKCDFPDQVTIHPIVTFYHHPTIENLQVRDAKIFITDDLKHDYFAVHHFLELAIQQLEQDGIDCQNLITWSDGAVAQYKCSTALAMLSMLTRSVVWNFFGSDHGKSECDGELGILNRSLDRAIAGGKVVMTNAEDMVNFCQENLTLDSPDSRRSYIHVADKLDRDDTKVNVNLMPGISSVHQVKNVGEDYMVEIRRLSCFCKACLYGAGSCVNQSYAQSYQVKELQLKEEKAKGKKKTVKDQEGLLERKKNNQDPDERITRSTGKKEGKAEVVVDKDARKTHGKGKKRSNVCEEEAKTKATNKKKGKDCEEELVQSERNTHGRGKKRSNVCEEEVVLDDKKTNTQAKRKKKGKDCEEELVQSERNTCGRGKKKSKVEEEVVFDKEFINNMSFTSTDDFKGILAELGASESIEDLQNKATLILENMPDLPPYVAPTVSNVKGACIDNHSASMLPNDIPPGEWTTLKTYGDGDCFPRTMSVHAYLTEDYAVEMRLHMVLDMAINFGSYQDPAYLSRGSVYCKAEIKKLLKRYAHFTENWCPGDVLSDHYLKRLFFQEIITTCRISTYCGLYHFFAFANVFNMKVCGVYPRKGNPSVRRDLNRVFCPRNEVPDASLICVMWTDMGGASAHGWQPNHFVSMVAR